MANMTPNKSPFSSLAVLLLLIIIVMLYPMQPPATPQQLLGDSVTIWNQSFEIPILTETSSWADGATGWMFSGGGGTTWNLNTLEPYPAPKGNQYFYAAVGNQANDYGFSMTQQPGVLEPDTFYEISVDVYPLSGGDTSFQLRILEGATTYENLALQVYSPFFNDKQKTFEFVPGQWNTIRARFNTFSHPDYVGNNYMVQISGAWIALDNVRVVKRTMIQSPGNTDYFISSSSGSDLNSGLTQGDPWQSFDNVYLARFREGDRVLLRRGDSWFEELHVFAEGVEGNHAEIGSWGDGELPSIYRGDKENSHCVVVENPSYVTIRDLHGQEAKLGLYLRYISDFNNKDVVVENCVFEDNDSWTVDTPGTNYEISFNSGIFLGGNAGSGSEMQMTVLDGLTIRDCQFLNCTAGFLTGFYFPDLIYNRVTNVLIEDCLSTRVSAGGLCLNSVQDAVVRRFRTREACAQDGHFEWGSTGAILSSCRNILIDDCEFSETDRMFDTNEGGDGCGFDIDGRNVNVTVQNTVFHHNDGPGLLFLATFAEQNRGVLVEDCTFYNNGLDGAVSFGGNAYEMKITGNTVQGTFRRLGLYRSDPSWDWVYYGALNSVVTADLRQYWHRDYGAARPDPLWYFESNGNLEGWNGFNQWEPDVAGGLLTGTSLGDDPFANSPEVWINTHLRHVMKVTMSQTMGDTAQVFFIKETDPVWDGDKSLAFPIIPDGIIHSYYIDLRQNENCNGVLTGVRLDPTIATGSEMEIDEILVLPPMELLPPLAPESLQAESMSVSSITLTWTDLADDEEHYILERSSDGENFSWHATLPADSVQWIDEGLSVGQTFWYRLRAFNASGFSLYSNIATATITEPQTPTPSVTPSMTPSPSATATPTAMATPTPSITPSLTASPTDSPTVTVSPTLSPTESPTPTFSPTVSPSSTPSITVSPTITATPIITPTETPVVTPTPDISRRTVIDRLLGYTTAEADRNGDQFVDSADVVFP